MPFPASSAPRQPSLLPDLRAGGALQMALDAWMLAAVVRGEPGFDAGPVLRFYRWSPPGLSLGAHQRRWPPHWAAVARRHGLMMVRRPSGGRAVLHGGGLTYAVAWPGAPRPAERAYGIICDWLSATFAELGEPLRRGCAAPRRQPSHCFAAATPADLVDGAGRKRIGSAQRWHGPHLLQHGEILLHPPAEIWAELFSAPPPPPPDPDLPAAELAACLVAGAERHWWGTQARPLAFPPGLIRRLSCREDAGILTAV
jgi:lipoate-protein ligase A